MKNQRIRRMVAWLVMATLTLTQATQVAALTLASAPLASTTSNAVRPNIMYVLDDSGSMAWDFTPDYINDATVSDPASVGFGLPGSSGDAAVATVSGGRVTAISASGINVYSKGTPQVIIEGGGGTGASATAVVNATTKKITSITVNNGGSGYTSTPYVALVGGLSNVAWGMCWGVSGGKPIDTTLSPTCTTPSQMSYATGKINYQYYDPTIRYSAPLNANGSSYSNSTFTAALQNGYSGSATTNLSNGYTHEVWCSTSTPSPTPSAANIATHPQCKENTDTSNNALYPNAIYTVRKTYQGPAFYFVMEPAEFCSDTTFTNCNGSTSPSPGFNIASYYRWCSYYNPLTRTFGGCQGNRNLDHYIPDYLGGWVTTGTPGSQATALMTINSLSPGQSLTNITIGGVDVVGGIDFAQGDSFVFTSSPSGTRTISTPSDVAQAICQQVNANSDTTGYGCSQVGSGVNFQAVVAGTAANNREVIATGPGASTPSFGTIEVSEAPVNFQITGISITHTAPSVTPATSQLINSTITATTHCGGITGVSCGPVAQTICQNINNGPSNADYEAKSGDPADTLLLFGTCNSHVSALVTVRRKDNSDIDNGALIAVTGPAASNQYPGTITVSSIVGPTKIDDIKVGAASILASKPMLFADGTATSSIASAIAANISHAGCTATVASGSNVINISGSDPSGPTPCAAAITVTAAGSQATGTFRVSNDDGDGDSATPPAGAAGSLGNIDVGSTRIVGVLTAANLPSIINASANASTLRAQINNGTSAISNSVGPHGFSVATAPVQSGSFYDVTVTAPAGNTYNGMSFTFGNGTEAGAGAGSQPVWSFKITGASTDNVNLSSIMCGSDTAVGTLNTGTTTNNVTYVQNLATAISGQTVNGYVYSCTNASMTSPAYRCTVTGPAGAANCTNLSFTKDSTINLSGSTQTNPGAAATNNTWSFTFSNATSDGESISAIRCGTSDSSTNMLQSTISLGSTTNTYAANLADGLDDGTASNWDQFGDQWSASNSSCSYNDTAGTVSCTYQKKTNSCTDPVITVGSGLSVSGQSPASGTLNSSSNLTFTINGATAANRTVTAISCAVSSLSGTPTTGSGTAGAARATALASSINSNRSSTWWNTSGTPCTASGTVVTCGLTPLTGMCPSSTGLEVTVSSGMSVSSAPSFSGGKWNFTISGADANNETVTGIKCRPNVLGATASTGSSGSTDSAVVQRLNDIRSDLNGQDNGTYSWSCPTAATNASASLTCTASGPGTCTSTQLRMQGSNNTGIYVSGNANQIDDSARNYSVNYTAGSGAVSPVWTFDILDATTANKTISAMSCGTGGSLVNIRPTTAPNTGAEPTGAVYTRINNMTGATLPSTNGSKTSASGYVLSCPPASATNTQPTCTLTGPAGIAKCTDVSTGDFVITKDSSITLGTVTRTAPGSAVTSATKNFRPYLSTLSPFSSAYGGQPVSTTGISATPIATGTISTNVTAMSSYTPSALVIPTNATGTAAGRLNMSGGADASAATNHWTGIGVFKRVDIVSTDNSYDRSSGRTDCMGSTCTFDEEKVNFANWYTYYRTRMNMMKSASTAAFSPIDGGYRVGFDNICQATSTTSIKRTVAQFVDSGGEVSNQKTNWWSQLTGATPSCSTPLRAETAKIGKYFAHKLGSIADPMQYSCQQNYMILVTDGYWNEDDPSATSLTGSDIGNKDNSTSAAAPYTAARPFYDGEQASTTCPGTGSTRSVASSCRTLADIAWYYYSTDLRTSALSNNLNAANEDISTNNVLVTADDQNTAQHMNFFAMGLGIEGELAFKSNYETSSTGDFASIRAGTLNWPAVKNLDPTGVDDLWHATVNGHGKYFSARNVPAVVAGLQDALRKIGSRVGSAAAAATSNLEPVAGDNFAYVASYSTNFWVGDLQSRSIDISTGDVSPDTNCNVTGSGCQWSAQAKLDNMVWSTRRLFVAPAAGTVLRPFTYDDLSATEKGYFDPTTSLSQSSLSDVNFTALNLVNFLRGDRSFEQDGDNSHAQLWRKRAHVLGDIVNTQPIFMKQPSLNYSDDGYAAFKSGTAGSRKPVVFVSSQDGMLHSFNAHTSVVTVSGVNVNPGEEMWAYIPKQVLPGMKQLANASYSHRYYVDGPITVGDVKFADDTWHTILVAGMGAGGNAYFALDVTDPTNPSYLWEYTNTSLGYTFSNPIFSKLPATGEWVVLFSSGYNSADGEGKLFALNPQTGAAITGTLTFPLTTGSGTAGAPSNLGKIAVWADNPGTDNTAQYVYAGDINGDLWRFDLDQGASGHSGATVHKLAHLKGSDGFAQPITTKPELTQLPDGTRAIFVGTGKYLEETDKNDTNIQSFYAIKDPLNSTKTWDPRLDTVTVGSDTLPAFVVNKFISEYDNGTPITRTSGGATRNVRMICRGASSTVDDASGLCTNQSTTTMDWGVYGGWLVDFPESKERMNVDMKLVLGSLVFATNIPVSDSCTVGGSSWANVLYYKDGLAVPGSDGFVGVEIADSLVVGVTVVKLSTGQYKAINTKSNYQQQTTDVPVCSGSSCNNSTSTSGNAGGFMSKRGLWREFEAY